MLKRIEKIIRRLLNRSFVKVDEESKEEFTREIIRENFFRLYIISVLMFLFECYLFSIEESIFYVGSLILNFLIFCAVLIPFILYININYKKANKILASIIKYSFAGICIVFGATLALDIQQKTDLVHMYLLMVFFSGAFLYMHPAGSFVLYFSTYMFFLLMLPQYVTDRGVIAVIITNTASSNVAAWLMSNVLWRSKILVFKSKKQLFLQNNRLREVNKKDHMTDLYNHEASLIILEKEIDLSEKLGRPLSIIIADIDDFKKINDNYGHLYGDQVIKEVSKAIKTTSRKTDFVGRYGGEEFIIIMPDADLDDAFLFSERLKERLRDSVIDEKVLVTLSGGVSQYSGEQMNALIRTTDQKLYVAKRTGKNRFEKTLCEGPNGFAGASVLENIVY